MFTQFYTRPTNDQTDEEVIDKVRKLTKLLGGKINETQGRWHTFDKFTYFQHFTVEQIKAGIYADLANMQGNDKTFYVGGATDFELVEPIVEHSKYIVEKHFMARSLTQNRWVGWGGLASDHITFLVRSFCRCGSAGRGLERRSLTIAREARMPTRGIPEECSNAVLDCVRYVPSSVE